MTDQPTELSSVPQSDLDWAHKSVQDVSRSFAITIEILDDPMSSYICTGYLMCRVADTFEDSVQLVPADKVYLLDQYDRVLDPGEAFDAEDFGEVVDSHLPATPSDEWTVVANTDRIFTVFERMPADVRGRVIPPTRELTQGMSVFVERYADSGGIRIQTADELDEYCHYVAGTVGRLVTNLVVREVTTPAHRRRLRRYEEGFGMLLQLVNIAKDVRVDYIQENNVYLPEEWLNEQDIPYEELISERRADDVSVVIERTIDRARYYLDDAQSYVEMLAQIDRNLFAAWAVPFLLAVGTLRELSDRTEDVLSERGVKVSRNEVAAVVNAVSETDTAAPHLLSSLRASVARGDVAEFTPD